MSALSNMGTINHLWVLSALNVATGTEELNFKYIVFEFI